jgi:hypothetical protein
MSSSLILGFRVFWAMRSPIASRGAVAESRPSSGAGGAHSDESS